MRKLKWEDIYGYNRMDYALWLHMQNACRRFVTEWEKNPEDKPSQLALSYLSAYSVARHYMETLTHTPQPIEHKQ